MKNKLICPFCGESLRKLHNKYTGEPNCDYECGNAYCDLYGVEMSESVWQALIQAKQDLEIARKALEEIRDETGEDRAGFSYVVLAINMKETAKKALETIGKHKE